MTDIHKNPNDAIDLSVAVSYSDDESSLYPQAHVYDPDGNEVSGSPFDLTHAGNGVYQNKAAFQVSVDSGTYDVLYKFYTDAGHTTEHGSYGRVHNTITISIQSTTGLGGDITLDEEELARLVKKKVQKLITPVAESVKTLINQEVVFDASQILKKIEGIPERVWSGSNEEILKVVSGESDKIIKSNIETRRALNSKLEKHNKGIKRNRSRIIQISDNVRNDVTKPVIQTLNEFTNSTDKQIAQISSELKQNSDQYLKEIKQIDIDGQVGDQVKNVGKMMDVLRDDFTKKLKFTLERLINIVILGRKLKQEIKIDFKDKK